MVAFTGGHEVKQVTDLEDAASEEVRCSTQERANSDPPTSRPANVPHERPAQAQGGYHVEEGSRPPMDSAAMEMEPPQAASAAAAAVAAAEPFSRSGCAPQAAAAGTAAPAGSVLHSAAEAAALAGTPLLADSGVLPQLDQGHQQHLLQQQQQQLLLLQRFLQHPAEMCLGPPAAPATAEGSLPQPALPPQQPQPGQLQQPEQPWRETHGPLSGDADGEGTNRAIQMASGPRQHAPADAVDSTQTSGGSTSGSGAERFIVAAVSAVVPSAAASRTRRRGRPSGSTGAAFRAMSKNGNGGRKQIGRGAAGAGVGGGGVSRVRRQTRKPCAAHRQRHALFDDLDDDDEEEEEYAEALATHSEVSEGAVVAEGSDQEMGEQGPAAAEEEAGEEAGRVEAATDQAQEGEKIGAGEDGEMRRRRQRGQEQEQNRQLQPEEGGCTRSCCCCDGARPPPEPRPYAPWEPLQARHQKEVPSAPIFHPTPDEFADPLSYIAKIRLEAAKYGICRVVPPASCWQPPAALAPGSEGRSRLRFRARRQLVSRQQGNVATAAAPHPQLAFSRGSCLTLASVTIPAAATAEVPLRPSLNADSSRGGSGRSGGGIALVSPVAGPSARPPGAAVEPSMGRYVAGHRAHPLLGHKPAAAAQAAAATPSGRVGGDASGARNAAATSMTANAGSGGESGSGVDEGGSSAARDPCIVGEIRDVGASARVGWSGGRECGGSKGLCVVAAAAGDGTDAGGSQPSCPGCELDSGQGARDGEQQEPWASGSESAEYSLDSFRDCCDWARSLHFNLPPFGDSCRGGRQESLGGSCSPKRPAQCAVQEGSGVTLRGEPPRVGHRLEVEDVEGEFWRIVEQPPGTGSSSSRRVEVLCADDLDSAQYGSGFPVPAGRLPPTAAAATAGGLASATCTRAAGVGIGVGGSSCPSSGKEVLRWGCCVEAQPWNLHDLVRAAGSVRRRCLKEEPELGHDALGAGPAAPTLLSVGSCLSARGWQLGELCAVHYLHEGAEKVWYAVPAQGSQRLEAAVREALQEPSPRKESELGARQRGPLLSPNELRRRGVSVYRLVQTPGSFVISFPGAHLSSLDCGFNLCEAATLAPPDLLPDSCAAAAAAQPPASPAMAPCLGRELLVPAPTATLGGQAVKVEAEAEVCGSSALADQAVSVAAAVDAARMQPAGDPAHQARQAGAPSAEPPPRLPARQASFLEEQLAEAERREERAQAREAMRRGRAQRAARRSADAGGTFAAAVAGCGHLSSPAPQPPPPAAHGCGTGASASPPMAPTACEMPALAKTPSMEEPPAGLPDPGPAAAHATGIDLAAEQLTEALPGASQPLPAVELPPLPLVLPPPLSPPNAVAATSSASDQDGTRLKPVPKRVQESDRGRERERQRECDADRMVRPRRERRVPKHLLDCEMELAEEMQRVVAAAAGAAAPASNAMSSTAPARATTVPAAVATAAGTTSTNPAATAVEASTAAATASCAAAEAPACESSDGAWTLTSPHGSPSSLLQQPQLPQEPSLPAHSSVSTDQLPLLRPSLSTAGPEQPPTAVSVTHGSLLAAVVTAVQAGVARSEAAPGAAAEAAAGTEGLVTGTDGAADGPFQPRHLPSPSPPAQPTLLQQTQPFCLDQPLLPCAAPREDALPDDAAARASTCAASSVLTGPAAVTAAPGPATSSTAPGLATNATAPIQAAGSAPRRSSRATRPSVRLLRVSSATMAPAAAAAAPAATAAPAPATAVSATAAANAAAAQQLMDQQPGGTAPSGVLLLKRETTCGPSTGARGAAAAARRLSAGAAATAPAALPPTSPPGNAPVCRKAAPITGPVESVLAGTAAGSADVVAHGTAAAVAAAALSGAPPELAASQPTAGNPPPHQVEVQTAPPKDGWLAVAASVRERAGLPSQEGQDTLGAESVVLAAAVTAAPRACGSSYRSGCQEQPALLDVRARPPAPSLREPLQADLADSPAAVEKQQQQQQPAPPPQSTQSDAMVPTAPVPPPPSPPAPAQAVAMRRQPTQSPAELPLMPPPPQQQPTPQSSQPQEGHPPSQPQPEQPQPPQQSTQQPQTERQAAGPDSGHTASGRPVRKRRTPLSQDMVIYGESAALFGCPGGSPAKRKPAAERRSSGKPAAPAGTATAAATSAAAATATDPAIAADGVKSAGSLSSSLQALPLETHPAGSPAAGDWGGGVGDRADQHDGGVAAGMAAGHDDLAAFTDDEELRPGAAVGMSPPHGFLADLHRGRSPSPPLLSTPLRLQVPSYMPFMVPFMATSDPRAGAGDPGARTAGPALSAALRPSSPSFNAGVLAAPPRPLRNLVALAAQQPHPPAASDLHPAAAVAVAVFMEAGRAQNAGGGADGDEDGEGCATPAHPPYSPPGLLGLHDGDDDADTDVFMSDPGRPLDDLSAFPSANCLDAMEDLHSSCGAGPVAASPQDHHFSCTAPHPLLEDAAVPGPMSSAAAASGEVPASAPTSMPPALGVPRQGQGEGPPGVTSTGAKPATAAAAVAAAATTLVVVGMSHQGQCASAPTSGYMAEVPALPVAARIAQAVPDSSGVGWGACEAAASAVAPVAVPAPLRGSWQGLCSLSASGAAAEWADLDDLVVL